MRSVNGKMTIVLVLLGMAFCSCDRDFSMFPVPSSQRSWTSLEKRVMGDASDFGIRLFKEVVKTDPGKNVFVSPFSVSMALGMTLNGANSQTEADMRDVLGFSDLNSREINETYKSLIDRLGGMDPKVVLDIANSIWHRNDFQVEQSFIETNRNYFYALVQGLDFALPTAAATINRWIEDNTNGKIRDMIKRIDPLDVMFLVNAVYFKGIWTFQFDPDQTTDGAFIREDGSGISCSMMKQRTDISYLSINDFQAVDLPYGDGSFSMLIVLPAINKTIDSFIQGVTPEKWKEWMGQFSKTDVSLILPKFKTEYDVELKQVLKEMGMGIAFSATADFTRINKEGGLLISRVLHKAFVEVNEEGTEATAATVVVVGRTSIGDPTGVMMIVNRPFVFMIREKQTGAVLFAGKIADPTK